MYHCHLHFYLAGRQNRVFDIIKEMPPLENFAHEFAESSELDQALAAEADVILADLESIKAVGILETLAPKKDEGKQVILIVQEDQFFELEEYPPQIRDIWTASMSDREIRFRFLRWQQACKAEKDFWETKQYLEAAINHSPNLVWYKDKEGIHRKVNDSFCNTVNKTRQQVEGRGHAYIWDVEEDDPACIESEQEVMRKRATCVSEEIIKTGKGMRTLTTYKSPLYDLDGSVMGTVGVAIDVTQERAYEQEIIKKNHTLKRFLLP